MTKLNLQLAKTLEKLKIVDSLLRGKKAGTGFIERALGTEKSRLNVQAFDKVASLKILNDYIS